MIKGSKHTAETLAKMSVSQIKTDIRKAQQSAIMKGRKHTAEHNAKITATLTQHGHARNGKVTSEHHAWNDMKQRCYNSNNPRYKDYGGRGITVCYRWLNSFENFLADMGPKPLGLSLDRKDNEGNYTLDNCRWATPMEQAANRRPAKKRRKHWDD